MKLPERDQLIAAVRGLRDDCCVTCDCKDKPDFHEANCSGAIPVRLQFNNEDDWDILQGVSEDEEAICGSSTVAFGDDDDVIESVVEQLLEGALISAYEFGLWDEEAELVEGG